MGCIFYVQSEVLYTSLWTGADDWIGLGKLKTESVMLILFHIVEWIGLICTFGAKTLPKTIIWVDISLYFDIDLLHILW